MSQTTTGRGTEPSYVQTKRLVQEAKQGLRNPQTLEEAQAMLAESDACLTAMFTLVGDLIEGGEEISEDIAQESVFQEAKARGEDPKEAIKLYRTARL